MMGPTSLGHRAFSGPVLVGGGIAVGLIAMAVIALMGGFSRPSETTADEPPPAEQKTPAQVPNSVRPEPAPQPASEPVVTVAKKGKPYREAKAEGSIEPVADAELPVKG